LKIQNIITEAAKPKPKAYAPMRKNIEKNIKMINQSLKYADARAKKMPDNESLLWKIMVLAERLEHARDEFDSLLSFTVPSGSTGKR